MKEQRTPENTKETMRLIEEIIRATKDDERVRTVDAARRAAEAALPSLIDMDDAPELALMQRALDVCRRLRDATTADERDTAIAIACAIADEAG